MRKCLWVSVLSETNYQGKIPFISSIGCFNLQCKSREWCMSYKLINWVFSALDKVIRNWKRQRQRECIPRRQAAAKLSSSIKSERFDKPPNLYQKTNTRKPQLYYGRLWSNNGPLKEGKHVTEKYAIWFQVIPRKKQAAFCRFLIAAGNLRVVNCAWQLDQCPSTRGDSLQVL